MMSSPYKNSIEAWDINAEFWDSRMGEGNDFHRFLIAPTTLKLLNLQPGQPILDICCGNGQFSRQLHRLGAKVTAIDGSKELIAIAKEKSSSEILYQVVDVTDQKELVTLCSHPFEAAVCNMALMDIPDIAPLLKALKILLKKGGTFIFSISHPCFNRPGMEWFEETLEKEGQLIHKKGVKISDYISLSSRPIQAMSGQPIPHYCWNRPLSYYLQTVLQEGFTLTGIEEPTFSPSYLAKGLWAERCEIPPILIVKMQSL